VLFVNSFPIVSVETQAKKQWNQVY